MRDVFWFNNPQIIFKNYNVFFPNKNFSLIKNLNAVVRLFVYYTLLCIIFTNNDLYDVIKPNIIRKLVSLNKNLDGYNEWLGLYENKKLKGMDFLTQ